MASAGGKCHRLGSIVGLDNRKNDLIYCSPVSHDQECRLTSQLVVFFGGDVQEYPEVMEKHRDNRRHLQWNLDSTAELLSRKFPRAHVIVVRPVAMYLSTFSRFGNFVDSNDIGVPNYSADGTGFEHLKALVENAMLAVGEQSSVSGSHSVVLVGFSKGCVVLNQFLYELGRIKANADLNAFWEKVGDIYWLDGGHSGGKNTWVTEESILKELFSTSSTHLNLHVHVTPYQVKDARRPWIGKEEAKFCSILRRFGVLQIDRTLHFENKVASLENHFMVLDQFKEDAS